MGIANFKAGILIDPTLADASKSSTFKFFQAFLQASGPRLFKTGAVVAPLSRSAPDQDCHVARPVAASPRPSSVPLIPFVPPSSRASPVFRPGGSPPAKPRLISGFPFLSIPFNSFLSFRILPLCPFLFWRSRSSRVLKFFPLPLTAPQGSLALLSSSLALKSYQEKYL